MLNIRPEQLQALRVSIGIQHRQDKVLDILAVLQENVPRALAEYSSQEIHKRIEEVVEACEKYKIEDIEHLLNWSYISFLTNVRFYDSDQFSEILEHPFLHPVAKGRHIVLAFFAIQRMAQERR